MCVFLVHEGKSLSLKNIWQIIQHTLPRAEWERSIYGAKLYISSKSAIHGLLHTLKEFTILESTVLSVDLLVVKVCK